MSYLVLARKSRPGTFAAVVGQKPVVRTLQNALAQNRVAHALIFSGVRGVGKTTLARIMAKALNCEKGPAMEPCEQCRSCLDIKSGSSVDLVEIDGASNRGIQEIRELKENIRFMPTGSRYKIIIIDEVHMLTTEAFNALLKTLEEPPDHVFFMFATTELHRVPVTILSRCQRYELKRIDNNELSTHFDSIARSENIQIDPAALNLVVREAGGSVRDGLSLLDQIFSYCGDTVTPDDVVEVLGLVGHQVISGLARALLAGDMTEILRTIDSVCEYGMDLKRFINDLLSWFRALVVFSVSDSPEEILDLPDDEMNELGEIVATTSRQSLLVMFALLLENLEKAGVSTRPRFALELALIKAVQARDVVPLTSVLGRLDKVLEGKEHVSVPEADLPVKRNECPPRERAVKKKEIQSETSAVQGEEPAIEQQEVTEDTAYYEDKASNKETVVAVPDETPTAEDVDPGEVKAAPVINGQPSDPELFYKLVRQNWQGFIEYVRDRKPWMASALGMSSGMRFEDGVLVLQYDDATGCRMLKNREYVTPLTEFATDFFQKSFRIQFAVPDSTECDISETNGNNVQKERQALANDALVLTAVDIFNGEVGDIRVGPRFRKPLDEAEKK